MAVPKVQVTVPKTLVKAAKSRVRPSEIAEKGIQITQSPAWNLLTTATRDYRSAASIVALIRHLARAEGPFATAVHTMVETAFTKYKVFAYEDNTGKFSTEGTITALAVLASMDTPTEYDGITQKRSIDETVKMMLREVILTGALASELVLNKARLPDLIQVVGAETIDWVSDGKGRATPQQQIAGEDDPISLNLPNFFFSHMSPDPGTVTPRSMMEACIKMLVYFGEFLDEIRRSVRVAGHNRLTISLDVDKIKGTAPAQVKNDPKKFTEYLESVRSGVEEVLASIDPEQALVLFNSAQPSVLQSGTGTKIDYTPLLNVIVGQYATAMKTPPSVLGLRLEGGSQQMGSVETLIFLKGVKALHVPVETVMSRILTLSCRLLGSAVTVWFRMEPPDLRPELELEAFRTMRDSRILDKLSLGLISDDEAAVEMDCFPRPEGSPDLSGTFFRNPTEGVTNNPGDTPMGRDLQPDKDAPRKAGGRSQ